MRWRIHSGVSGTAPSAISTRSSRGRRRAGSPSGSARTSTATSAAARGPRAGSSAGSRCTASISASISAGVRSGTAGAGGADPPPARSTAATCSSVARALRGSPVGAASAASTRASTGDTSTASPALRRTTARTASIMSAGSAAPSGTSPAASSSRASAAAASPRAASRWASISSRPVRAVGSVTESSTSGPAVPGDRATSSAASRCVGHPGLLVRARVAQRGQGTRDQLPCVVGSLVRERGPPERQVGTGDVEAERLRVEAGRRQLGLRLRVARGHLRPRPVRLAGELGQREAETGGEIGEPVLPCQLPDPLAQRRQRRVRQRLGPARPAAQKPTCQLDAAPGLVRLARHDVQLGRAPPVGEGVRGQGRVRPGGGLPDPRRLGPALLFGEQVAGPQAVGAGVVGPAVVLGQAGEHPLPVPEQARQHVGEIGPAALRAPPRLLQVARALVQRGRVTRRPRRARPGGRRGRAAGRGR